MREKKSRATAAVIVSDLHCGCRFGLSLGRLTLDGGMRHEPSALQQHLARHWRYFWRQWVPEALDGRDWVCVINGDYLDGRHHGTVTQISHNLADQSAIFREAWMRTEDMWHRDPLAVYCVRGTEAHAGASGEAEESAARLINATQDGHGHSSRHELWLRLGPHYLAHCAHTLGTTSSPSYETTALCREYVDAASEAGKWGLPPPDWVVRSHRHRHAEVRLPTRHARATVIVTAGWQLRTPFSYRTAGGRTLLPQVGGSAIIAGDHEPYSRSYVRAVERDKPEVV